MYSQDIRVNNARAILSCIRCHDGISKRDIAAKTNLSFSTVSNLCNSLIDRGVLYSCKSTVSSVGRMPDTLFLSYSSNLFVCIDLQRKNTLGFAVLNLRNEIMFYERFDTTGYYGIREIANFAKSVFKDKCSQYEDTSFIGIGVSVSGIFDKGTETIIDSAIPAMEDAPVKAVMEEVFGMPCYVDNEANLCAAAVSYLHPDVTDILYMHISEGLGIGVISQGQLLSGYNGYAAEIAHIPFGRLGRRCPTCGCLNCIETELSIPWLLQNPVWKETTAPDMVQWRAMAQRINSGDPAYCDFLEEKGTLIGKTLSVLIDLFNPQQIYIGGEISDFFEKLRPYVEQEIFSHCFLVRNFILPVVCDHQASKTMILGLASIMCNRWDPLNGKFS